MNTQTQQEVKLICMSFDGDYVTEGSFATAEEAWERSNDMGSRWFFYPFHFVTTASGKTIKDAPEMMRHLIGLRVNVVANHFSTIAKTKDAVNADAEQFAFLV